MSEAMKRVDRSDPRRCQAIRNGQCEFEAVEGSQYCKMHGGAMHLKIAEQDSLNSYRLGKYQQRMRQFATSTRLRSIDEEIGILRMLLETIFERCEKYDMDVYLYSQKITELVHAIRNCVIVADKLATKDGMLIGRDEAIKIAQKVIEILPKYINNQEDLLKIADELSEAFVQKVPATEEMININENL